MNRLCKCGAQLPHGAKKFCTACRAARRPLQLWKAAKRFRQRARKVSPHIYYRGELTAWAKAHPEAALKLWHRRNPDVAVAPPELIRSLCTVP